MMRNWFILFATTFTISVLSLTISTSFIASLPLFSSQYVILLAISSALISLFLLLVNRLPIENVLLTTVIDILFIFIIVYGTGIIINFIPITLIKVIIVLALVIVIYILITLIYMFILKKEAEDMNKKILQWRHKHVESESYK